MSLKALFASEMCIRLSDDLSALVCTARLGRFRMKSNEFVIEDRQARLAESSLSHVVSEPIRPRYHVSRDSDSEPR
jgi:hypothetical protein